MGYYMIITFIGHAYVPNQEMIKEKVKEQLRELCLGADEITCYLGGRGDFDNLSAIACKELQPQFPLIERIYVAPYITQSEQSKINLLIKSGLYDSSLYPPIETTPIRFAISKRNEWMIAKSDIVIAFVKHSYGGAYNSLKIAKRKKKTIITIQ